MHRLLVMALLVVAAAPATAQATDGQPVWRSAEQVRQNLFDAQAELILGTTGDAAAKARRASRAYRGALRAGLRGTTPDPRLARRFATRRAPPLATTPQG